ncbi:MAG: aldehyde reductase, partial [Pseudomonadota bacterium]|nr:aldehyde reductase [Pseudomonadota bacterium]
EQHPELELVMINPSLVLGPRLAAQFSASINLVQMIMAGKYPLVPKVSFAPVDIRDVAAAHIAALTGKRPVGKRFILAGESIWMSELAEHLKVHSRKASSREMPNWLTRAAGMMDANVRSIRSELGLMRYFDTQPARKIMKFSPRPLTETVQDMVASIQTG